MRCLVAIFLIVVVVAIPTQQPTNAQARTIRIAFSTVDLVLPYYQIATSHVLAEAAKIGNVQVDIFNSKNLATAQQADLATILDKKYDGLMIGVVNPDLVVAGLQALIDADIPVVTIPRRVPGIEPLAALASDDTKGGQLLAEIVMKQFPKGARIFSIQGPGGASTSVNRNKGLHSVLDGKPEYQIVFEHSANFRRDEAKVQVTQGLKDTGIVPDVIITTNDEMGMGTVEALQQQGLANKVLVITYGAPNIVLAAMENRLIFATIEQSPAKLADKALHILVDYIQDGKEPENNSFVLSPFVITWDNMADADNYAQFKASQSATPEPTQAPVFFSHP